MSHVRERTFGHHLQSTRAVRRALRREKERIPPRRAWRGSLRAEETAFLRVPAARGPPRPDSDCRFRAEIGGRNNPLFDRLGLLDQNLVSVPRLEIAGKQLRPGTDRMGTDRKSTEKQNREKKRGTKRRFEERKKADGH